MRPRGLVRHSVHSQVLCQRGLKVTSFGPITSGQEWRNL